MKAWLAAPLLAVVAPLILSLGCQSSTSPQTSDIVSVVPWPDTENLTYLLKDKKSGQVIARGALGVAPEGGQTRLSQRFTTTDHSDESSVLVDSKTLKPVSGTRVIVGPNQREEVSSTYSEGQVTIKQGEKQSGLKVPDHSYDNDTSLFLWRTLDFHDGFTARYVTIITNRRSRQDVTVSVSGPEQVIVQAGQFSAWKVDVRTSNAHQMAWYADTPTRPLVKYDNDLGTIYELEKAP